MTIKSLSITTIIGSLIVGFIAFILLSNTLLFALNHSVSGFTVPLSGILIIVTLRWVIKRTYPETSEGIFLQSILILGITFIVALVINANIFDISFDGQTYHSEAIVGLAHGWNPYTAAVPPNAYYPDWVGFFTKGTWIAAASIYKLTNNFETGKVFNSLLLIASGCFSYSALATFPNISRRWRINISLLIMLNPISLCQLFTFYADGQLASCLVILISLLIILSQEQDAVFLLALGLLLVIILNIKLTGILYAGIIVAGFVGWNWWRNHKLNKTLVVWALSSVFVALIGVGFNPLISQYLRNTLEKGDPFYPVSWSHLIAIDRNMPQDFIGKDRFSKLFLSLFSKSQVDTKPTQLKIPFSFSVDELFNFRFPDERTGGFGPLFGGCLILAVFILTLRLTTFRKHPFPPVVPVLIGLIIISTLSTSEAWWARYTPQLWLVPLLIATLGMDTLLNRGVRWLTGTLLLILGLNTILVGSVVIVGILKDQSPLRDELAHLRQTADQYGPIPLNINGFPITTARFEQVNISYIITGELNCDNQHHLLIYSWSEICDASLAEKSP